MMHETSQVLFYEQVFMPVVHLSLSDAFEHRDEAL